MAEGGTPLFRVLVVEDDQSVRRMLRFSLRAVGFEVTEAATGGEAVRIMEQGATDAVVLDLGLPDGLGRRVLDRLRRGQEDMASFPVWLVISVLDWAEATKRYGYLGDRFLAKPFDPWILASRLEEMVAARGQRHKT